MTDYLSFSKARISGQSFDAGSYMIGDPCYFVPRFKWSGLLESCDYFSGGVGTFEWEGHSIRVVAYHTSFGDGCYTGSDGNSYCVDSGLLGIILSSDLELYRGKDSSLALADVVEHTFSSPFTVFAHDGTFYCGDFHIHTSTTDYPSIYDRDNLELEPLAV